MPLAPRVVVVSRKTQLQGLIERHGTRAAAAFYLRERGQDLARVEAGHAAFEVALRTVLGALPRDWRRTRVARPDLERFLFEPEDLIVALGQDGLVANVAKYLTGQPVVGIAPEPERQPGVLARHDAAHGTELLLQLGHTGRGHLERRTMVEATLDDGQVLIALNEIFIGHRSHQSARYRITAGAQAERHSSSGVLVTTGTGATGWASSLQRQRRCDITLPAPEEDRLAFFVREAWESPTTGCVLTEGELTEPLRLTSEMPESGVIFGDGIEADALAFGWGQTVTLTTSAHRLSLVA